MPWRYPPHMFDLYPWPVRRTRFRPANPPPNYSSSEDENEYEERELENPRYLYGSTPPFGLYDDYTAEPEEPRSPRECTAAGTPMIWVACQMRHLDNDGAREMTRLLLEGRSVEDALFEGLEYQENSLEIEERRLDMRVMERAQDVMCEQRRELVHHWDIIRPELERLLEQREAGPRRFARNMINIMTDTMATIDTPPGALETQPSLVEPILSNHFRSPLRDLFTRGLISHHAIQSAVRWSQVWVQRGDNMADWYAAHVRDPETERIADEAGLEPENEDVMLFRAGWMTALTFDNLHP